MSTDVLSIGPGALRGTDSNSLLRLYDRARDLLTKSPSRQERVRVDKTILRITKELQRRNVPL